jgi:ATP-binding cassette subfamily B protein
MSVGDLVLVNTYLLQLYQPLNWIGSIYRMIQQNFVEMEQLFSLLEEPVDIKDAPNATDLDALPYSRADSPLDAQPPPHAGLPSAGASTLNASALSGGPLVQADKCNREAGATARAWDDAVGGQWSIEFDNVYFSYDARREVLSNFSLTMRPGETVALVGPSGSGKSTVARLLCRLYDPTSGRVLIAGRDLRHVTLSSVRRTVGVIPQDAALFQNTIEYNIAYAKPGDGAVPRTEVEEAAQGAQMHTGILAFPDGYQSQVGERGLRLSGGERQRLSLARVLLKQAPVVVLDEATSALDSRTEAQVQVALQRACAGRTTLVIAHRLSTISHADRILVLVNGSVAEAGSHQELLKRNGHYADMWKLQQPTP